MSECIVVTSGKGGVGKTTVSSNIGVSLASRGYKVGLIDADVGLRNLDLILGVEQKIVWDFVHVIKGQATLAEALIECPHNSNLFLLSASSSTGWAQNNDKMAIGPDEMISLVDQMFDDHEFDYILIDSPAGIERGFNYAAAAADRAIVVVTPEVSSIRDADRVIGLLEKKKMANVQMVINRYNPTLVERGDMLDTQDVWHILGSQIIGVLPETTDVLVASNKGEPLVLREDTISSAIFHNTADRLIGKNIPLIDLHQPENGSVWGKIRNWARTRIGA
jgi:septum site-determining protein MinD